MSTRTRHNPSALSVEIARLIDAARVDRRPRMTIAELARQADIEPSQLSRMLKPEKPMLVQELDALCAVLGLDLGQVMGEASRRVREAEDERQPTAPAPASTGQVPARPAHGHGRPRASRSASTRRRGTR